MTTDTPSAREKIASIKADPGDGTVAPDLAHVLARGFDAMGWGVPQHAAEDMIEAILALLPDAAAIRADASYLDFIEKNTDMELSCSWEYDDGPWEVHSVTGGRSDREWRKVGQGRTPREAIAAAIRAAGEKVK